jgi:hypothetical protein
MGEGRPAPTYRCVREPDHRPWIAAWENRPGEPISRSSGCIGEIAASFRGCVVGLLLPLGAHRTLADEEFYPRINSAIGVSGAGFIDRHGKRD